MHSSFYIEKTKGKRQCKGCYSSIDKDEKCFVESSPDGMYVRKNSYHLKCGIKFIEKVLKDFNNLIAEIEKESN
jgi:hypothetical protein